jgi:hypothetical protein
MMDDSNAIVLVNPLAPTAQETWFLNGTPEHDRRVAWEKIFLDEKVVAKAQTEASL